jgi:hypothetical protein
LSSLDGVEDFGLWLRREALRRGMGGAKKVVLLIDGASGLEKMGKDYFPGELQIVDFYHGLEHLEEVLKLLWEKTDQSTSQTDSRQWLRSWLSETKPLLAAAQPINGAQNPRRLDKYYDTIRKAMQAVFQEWGFAA